MIAFVLFTLFWRFVLAPVVILLAVPVFVWVRFAVRLARRSRRSWDGWPYR